MRVARVIMRVLQFLTQKLGAEHIFGVVTVFPHFVLLFIWPSNFSCQEFQNLLVVFYLILANEAAGRVFFVVSDQILYWFFGWTLGDQMDMIWHYYKSIQSHLLA